MLYNQDYFYLNTSIGQIKSTMMRLASEFGPSYCSTFMLTFNEIKERANRQRLTEPTINEYINFLRSNNFSVVNNGSALLVEACVSSLVLSPNESHQLSNSLEMFRLRAGISGDVENM